MVFAAMYTVTLAAVLVLNGCKKNTADLSASPQVEQMLAHKAGNAATEKVITNLRLQLQKKDYSADFLKWHGQPLWDDALTLKKDDNNFILLVPAKKNNTIASFIAARLKEGKYEFELHRRSALQKNLEEYSAMNINAEKSQVLLSYFTNKLLNKVDNVPYDLYNSLQANTKTSNTGNNNPSPDNYITICWNVGYCGPDACPPGSPEGGVCCTTHQVCQSFWFSDDGGGLGGGCPSCPPGGGGGNPGGGGGNPGCGGANGVWYSESPTPCPGDNGDCSSVLNNVTSLPQNTDISTIKKVIDDETQNVTKVWMFHFIFVNTPTMWMNYNYLSKESGTIKKVSAGPWPPDFTYWIWQSLSHVSTSSEGSGFGLTATLQDVSATPIINGDYAKMQLNYTIKLAANCQGIPMDKYIPGSSTSKDWFAEP